MWKVSDVMFAPNLISSGVGAVQVGDGGMRVGDARVASLARHEGAAVVRVRLRVVGDDGVDDALRDLGAAGTVEVGDGPAVDLDGE